MDVADDLPRCSSTPASLEALNRAILIEATEVIRRAGYQATDDAVNAELAQQALPGARNGC